MGYIRYKKRQYNGHNIIDHCYIHESNAVDARIRFSEYITIF